MITGLGKPLLTLCTYKTVIKPGHCTVAKALLEIISFISVSRLVNIDPFLPPLPTLGRVSAGANCADVVSDICNYHQQKRILWL